MADPADPLLSRVTHCLEKLHARTGAESASLVHRNGRVIITVGAELPSALPFAERVFLTDRDTPLLPVKLPGLGIVYLAWLQLGSQQLILLVRCNEPRLLRFQQHVLDAAREIQGLLDQFAHHFITVSEGASSGRTVTKRLPGPWWP